jgi:hypothetical protein
MENMLDEMISEAKREFEGWRSRLEFLEGWRDRKPGVPSGLPKLQTRYAKPKPKTQRSKHRKAKPAPVADATEAQKLTLTNAIRHAIGELPRTSIEVADRVQRLIPGADRGSISAIINQRMNKGEFGKDDNLKLFIVRAARQAS